ncbi:MAG: hypothetical protein ACFE91_16060 [Promethearchaeota archaeon]
MKEKLKEIEKVISNIEKNTLSQIEELLNKFLKTHLKRSRINTFIGDYPTFIEPVYLEENVIIGDDVLLGPNVYIGNNCELKDYVEISNSIIFDNVIIGENIKLDKCILDKNTSLNFKNVNLENCILFGNLETKEEAYKIMLKFK